MIQTITGSQYMQFIKKYLGSLFFSSRLYWTLAGIASLFAVSFLVPGLFLFIKIAFVVFVALVI
ncbi:MAG: hypothetical protein EOO04_32830, partial [Chitinophagaceae bacterium]